jgi:hypothetical protein
LNSILLQVVIHETTEGRAERAPHLIDEFGGGRQLGGRVK